jgi:hypothetical protein
MTDFAYVGSELELFACATTWKSYVRSHLQPYLSGDILEVGAGIGSATATFNDGTPRRWVCLEPDRALAERIKPGLPPKLTNCEIVAGTLSDLGADQQFEADGAELARAAGHLKPDGVLAILSPALPWLFTPFDKAIGHYRRYTKNSLRSIAPRDLHETKCIYLDSVGLLASLGNKLFLRSPVPSETQIRFWDRFMVPISKFADRALGYALGRSILVIWRNGL